MKLRIALALLTAASPSAAATYTLEPNYTQVVFRWEHLGFSHPAAQIAQGAGTLEFDAMNPASASVIVSIPLASLATGVPDLDEHLKSEDFFEVAKFPAAVFTSTKVAPGAGKERLKVTGNLTLHGVTKQVLLDVTFLKVGTNVRTSIATVGFTATATIKRTDFGLGAFVPQVSDAIQIELTTQGAEAMAYQAYLLKKAAEQKQAAEKEAAKKK